MKKKLLRLLIMFLIIFTVAGCAKKEEPDEEEILEEEKADKDGKKKRDKKNKEKPETEQEEGVAVLDITNEESIMYFIAGEWKLVDTLNDKEYATLKIDENGNCVFTRGFDEVALDGTFKVKKHETYDPETDKLIEEKEYTGFELSFSGMDPITRIDIPELDLYTCDEETIGGSICISSNHLWDYMSLEWLGNGDSYIFENVFQDTERLYEEYDKFNMVRVQSDWVFRRLSSDTKDIEPLENEEFYGLIWNQEKEKDENKNYYYKYWIQTMEAHTQEAADEYTARRFTEGYFVQKNVNIAPYRISEDVSTYTLLHERKLEDTYPLLMCRFRTDGEGNIIDIKEVDRAYYGMYDLGTIEQEYSYDALKFTVNGMEYDITEYAPLANAIMDMYQVGDWVVVETHINPHTGAYILVNTLTGNVEKTIMGANLTWLGDDISTAVYSNYAELYNFKGHVIGTTDGEEIYDVLYDPSKTSVTVKDMNDKTFTFDTDISDSAMYAFADYKRSGKASYWEKFVNNAPYGAVAYVMENPPEDVAQYLPEGSEVDPGTHDKVAVVMLRDDTVVDLYEGSYNLTTYEFEKGDMIDYQGSKVKGGVAVFDMIIPEGIPNRCMYITNRYSEKATFPVTTLSGQFDICSDFILAD